MAHMPEYTQPAITKTFSLECRMQNPRQTPIVCVFPSLLIQGGPESAMLHPSAMDAFSWPLFIPLMERPKIPFFSDDTVSYSEDSLSVNVVRPTGIPHSQKLPV